MFEQEKLDAIRAFHADYPRGAELENYRKLRELVGSVKNIFFGDSITNSWPLQEFFPNHSILNRGFAGDNIYGLYDRLERDVFPYSPKRVFMLIGINGIDEEQERIISHTRAVVEMIQNKGIEVYLSSILPLRDPDSWDRFQYQDKIVAINSIQKEWAEKHASGFLDYHSVLRDESGQLAEEFAREDGTHVTFEAYCRMSEVIRPYLV